MTRRRVFVRGVGADALAPNWPASFARLAEGESAVAPIATFDATGFPSTVAAAIPECRASGLDPRLVLALPPRARRGRQAVGGWARRQSASGCSSAPRRAVRIW